MNRTGLLLALLILALFSLWGRKPLAAYPGTPGEAKVMLQKAIVYYKSVGRGRALADFTARKPPFHDRDLYVLCISVDGDFVANGGFPETVGSRADTIVAADGKGLGKAAWEAVSGKGEGEVRYRWVDPVTHNLRSKSTFFAKVGPDICGVGVYDRD